MAQSQRVTETGLAVLAMSAVAYFQSWDTLSTLGAGIIIVAFGILRAITDITNK